MRLFTLLFFGLLVSSLAVAQSSSQCSRHLADAEEAFEQGRLLFILDKNENRGFYECLELGRFTWEEEVRAHKLLTKTYQFTDNEVLAEESFVNLLKTDKEHQLAQDDPAELYFLYSKFITEPIFRISLKGGINKSLPNVIQIFQEKSYNGEGTGTGIGISFFGELLIDKHFEKIANGFEAGLGVNYTSLTYEVERSFNEGLGYIGKNNSTYVRFPLFARYNFNYNKKDGDGNRKKFTPYVFAGASYDLLLTADYVDVSRQGGEAFTLPDSDADLTAFNQVADYNISFFGGLGLKMRVGRSNVNFITFEARYDNQLLNYIEPDNRFSNSVVVQNIALIEDDLTINSLSFSFGYTISFYKIRKSK